MATWCSDDERVRLWNASGWTRFVWNSPGTGCNSPGTGWNSTTSGWTRFVWESPGTQWDNPSGWMGNVWDSAPSGYTGNGQGSSLNSWTGNGRRSSGIAWVGNKTHREAYVPSYHESRKRKYNNEVPAKLPPYTINIDDLGEKTLFDSHCHMDVILSKKLEQFQLNEYEQFLDNFPLMSHASLEGFITNLCQASLWVDSTSPLINTLLSRPEVYYSVGTHPHFAGELLAPQNYSRLDRILVKADPKCVAIGECGLDRSHKSWTSFKEQLGAFTMQVKLAIKHKKPLILHIRNAEKEALEALRELQLPSDWPIHRHCWSYTWEACQTWIDKFPASVVGLTPLVTFPTAAKHMMEVAKKLPLDKLVLETDAPYFLPGDDLGHTWDFSLPVHVANVAAQISAIRGCPVQDILSASRQNIKRVYGV